MSTERDKDEEKLVLPHHEQQPLCTTRLPYRQGRKLTAVKVYTITTESAHLLVFGVPSLSLRPETKSLFSKFGRLKLFHVSTEHHAEPFTETYHALYDNIQSARIAKRMLDTKNFYGGSLHVCYAPELESIEETKLKLFKRQLDVTNRLKNLQKEALAEKQRIVQKKEVKRIEGEKEKNKEVNERVEGERQRMLVDMSVENIIIDQRNAAHYNFNRGKRKSEKAEKERDEMKKFKPVFIQNLFEEPSTSHTHIEEKSHVKIKKTNANKTYGPQLKLGNTSQQGPVEIVDFTSTEKEVLSNINEALNYNKFGNEIVKKIPNKPVNRIQFNISSNNKTF